MRFWGTRVRAWTLMAVAAAVLVTSIAAPRPAAAADASLVVAALRVLEENYVEDVQPVALLNAALAAVREGTHASQAAIPDIPVGTAREDAEAVFTREFEQAAAWGAAPVTPLAYQATASMLASLHDSHTYFVPPPQFQARRQQLIGAPGITGIGIRVSSVKDDAGTAWIFVDDVLPDSPAERAGLRRFDRILEAGGVSLRNASAADASQVIRGAAGSTVDLVIQRGGEVRRVSAVRGPIASVPGYARFVAPGVIYARLYVFSRGASRTLAAALESLSAQEPVRAIILDVRGNPGGLVAEAVRVGGMFLPSHTALAQVDDREDGHSVLRTAARPLFPDTPLVVLVDRGSASASEMVAAALKEHRRATLVGEQTAGALGGAIEVALPEGGMSVTVERITTPGGVAVENVGISPDERVALSVADMVRGVDPQLEAGIRTAGTETLQTVP
jgi:carboxyl-terminal processing protease